jgi:hypothetical protein
MDTYTQAGIQEPAQEANALQQPGLAVEPHEEPQGHEKIRRTWGPSPAAAREDLTTTTTQAGTIPERALAYTAQLQGSEQLQAAVAEVLQVQGGEQPQVQVYPAEELQEVRHERVVRSEEEYQEPEEQPQVQETQRLFEQLQQQQLQEQPQAVPLQPREAHVLAGSEASVQAQSTEVAAPVSESSGSESLPFGYDIDRESRETTRVLREAEEVMKRAAAMRQARERSEYGGMRRRAPMETERQDAAMAMESSSKVPVEVQREEWREDEVMRTAARMPSEPEMRVEEERVQREEMGTRQQSESESEQPAAQEREGGQSEGVDMHQGRLERERVKIQSAGEEEIGQRVWVAGGELFGEEGQEGLGDSAELVPDEVVVVVEMVIPEQVCVLCLCVCVCVCVYVWLRWRYLSRCVCCVCLCLYVVEVAMPEQVCVSLVSV